MLQLILSVFNKSFCHSNSHLTLGLHDFLPFSRCLSDTHNLPLHPWYRPCKGILPTVDESLTQANKNAQAVCSVTMNVLGTTKAVSALKFIIDVKPNRCSAVRETRSHLETHILLRASIPTPGASGVWPPMEFLSSQTPEGLFSYHSYQGMALSSTHHLRQKGLIVFTFCLLSSPPYTHFPSLTRFFFYIFISKYLYLKLILDL